MDEERLTLNYYKWVFLTSSFTPITGLLHIPSLGPLSWRGISWITMFFVAMYYLNQGRKVTMPYKMWLPWIIWVSIYWLNNFTFIGLQASLQYICFPIVGFAASTFIYTDGVLMKLFKWGCWYAVFVSVLGIFNKIGNADTVMTYTLFSCLFLAIGFEYKQRKWFIIYLVMLLVTVSFMTRMGILMMLTVGAFNFANHNIARKIFYGAIICIAGIAIFYSEGFQKKTFGEDGGTLNSMEISSSGIKNINTSGREALWEAIDQGVSESPWFGHGTRSDLVFLARIGRTGLMEFHNDYKAVAFNYGYIGLIFIIGAFVLQFFNLRRKKNDIHDRWTLLLWYACMTAFIPWIGYMYSDNILKYSIQFGNMNFAMIAIVYSRIYYHDELLAYEKDLESGDAEA